MKMSQMKMMCTAQCNPILSDTFPVREQWLPVDSKTWSTLHNHARCAAYYQTMPQVWQPLQRADHIQTNHQPLQLQYAGVLNRHLRSQKSGSGGAAGLVQKQASPQISILNSPA
mmetsp:Transcript_51236/g.84391  ORF Transcript_51236/g.84391 Transcript_51236/m.84391 type:complete len:114 (-) Transcript_51236:1194-1535(-)